MNASAAPAVYSIDVTYPTTSSHFEVAVAAGSNKLVHLEVPPYWRAVLGKGDPLPACGGKEERLVTIKLSGPSGASRTFDNCEYLHDVMKATDGAAVAFDGSLAAVVNSPAMGGNALFIVLVVAVAALLAGGATLVFLLRRRRGVKGSD